MKQVRLLIIAHVLLFGYLLSGCGRRPQSSGTGDGLFVVCDQENWQELEHAVRTTFERLTMTPQPEQLFEVFWVSPEEFDDYATRKNLIILGILNEEGDIDKQVENMLSPAVKEKVIAGEAFYFTKESPWAEGQLLVVLAGTDPLFLASKLESNRTRLYDMFYNRLREYDKAEMYKRAEQVDLEKTLLEAYGWTLRIQHDYLVEYNKPENRFVMLRRILPGIERWLFVHWIEDGDPAMIDADWVVATRNQLTGRYYEKDRVEKTYLDSANVMLAGHPAYLVKGLWSNDEKVVGGPFRNYTFYHPESKRIYMIDIAVYHPSGKKLPFLRQLDIMANTFKTADDLKVDIKEDS